MILTRERGEKLTWFRMEKRDFGLTWMMVLTVEDIPETAVLHVIVEEKVAEGRERVTLEAH